LIRRSEGGMIMTKYFKIFSCLLVIAVLGVSFNSAVAEENNIDDIKFLQKNWMPKLLRIIEDGPVLFSRDEVFDVAPPPKNSSKETQAELAELHKFAEEERVDETVQRILYENTGVSAHAMFVKENLIDKENYQTLALMEMIDNDNIYFIIERKKHFARPRPSEIDPTLTTVIDNPPHAAYPSGHATQTYINALVLADFDPENAEVYKQFAIDIAHRREIAGVHYTSDSVAGRKLAADVLARLRAIKVFEKKYQRAKASYIKPDLSKRPKKFEYDPDKDGPKKSGSY